VDPPADFGATVTAGGHDLVWSPTQSFWNWYDPVTNDGWIAFPAGAGDFEIDHDRIDLGTDLYLYRNIGSGWVNDASFSTDSSGNFEQFISAVSFTSAGGESYSAPVYDMGLLTDALDVLLALVGAALLVFVVAFSLPVASRVYFWAKGILLVKAR